MRTPLVVIGTFLALVAPVGPVDAAPAREAPFTTLASIPGTTEASLPASTTTPDGTDVVVWVGGESGDKWLAAAVRAPGRSTWRTVRATVRDDSINSVTVAPLGTRDVQVVWRANGFQQEEVYTSRLSTKRRAWSAPVRVFTDDAYHYLDPKLGVGAEGSVVIAAYADPIGAPSPAPYRTVVSVQRPGRAAVQTFLTPADGWSQPHTVSVGRKGQVLVTYTTGFTIGTAQANAATLGGAADATWEATTLTVPGAGNTPAGAIGPDGRAVVTWVEAIAQKDVSLATGRIRPAGTTWTSYPVTTGGGLTYYLQAAMSRSGAATVFWSEYVVDHYELRMRTLRATTLDPVVSLSPGDRNGAGLGVTMRPDGKSVLVWREYLSGMTPRYWLQTALLEDGKLARRRTVAESQVVAYDAYPAGVDAASRSNLVARVSSGMSSGGLQWAGQAKVKPAVLKNALSTKRVTKATLVSKGRRLTCRTGFWVDSTKPKHRWFRDGKPLRGARKATYRWTSADRGHRLSCTATGKSKLAKKSLTLKSKGRLVR